MMLTLLTSVCLMGPASIFTQTNPQVVQAASKGKLQVKGNKKVRLYTSSGKKSKYYAYTSKTYSYSAKKYLKIGNKKYLAYKIGNNSHWILAKNVKLVNNQLTKYGQATIKLSSGYTRSALLQAYKGKPSEKFIEASVKGVEENDFSRTMAGESASDKEIIDIDNLSTAQKRELTDFSLRLINSARQQLGLTPWIYSNATQKLADDIANKYAQNGRSIKDQGHYVAGIVKACQENGLKLDDNYVEDMAGFTTSQSTMSMGEMKRNVYFGLKQMIFGFAGSGENERTNRSLYREWEHAGDLFNTQGSSHDGDYNYYGFSISKTGKVYSMHYISVPSFIVNNAKYNANFRP